jgi:hypothetical protein
MLGAALVVPPVRRFLALPAPTLSALLLSAATAPAAVVVADRLASGAAIDEHARGSVVLRREAPDSQEERPEELEHGR